MPIAYRMRRQVLMIVGFTALLVTAMTVGGNLPFSEVIDFGSLSTAQASFTSYMPNVEDELPFSRAKRLIEAKRGKQAAKILLELRETNPELSDYINFSLAEARTLENDTAAAIVLLKEITEKKKKAVSRRAHAKLADIYFKSGAYSEAIKSYRSLKKRYKR